MDFIQEHLTTFLLLGGLVVFFILRDIMYFFSERRRKHYFIKHMSDSEARVDTLLKALEKDRREFMESMIDVDERFSTLKDHQDSKS